MEPKPKSQILYQSIETILRWAAYISAIFALVIALIVYDKYNVTESIKDKEVKLVISLLDNINSKRIYLKSFKGFRIITNRNHDYQSVIIESNLTSVTNVLDKEDLKKEFLVDQTFEKYLTDLQKSYMNKPIPLSLKKELKNCSSSHLLYFPIKGFDGKNLSNQNIIGTNYPFILTETLISFCEGTPNNFQFLTTGEFFIKWKGLHNKLLDWLQENSEIDALKYYEKSPTFVRYKFSN